MDKNDLSVYGVRSEYGEPGRSVGATKGSATQGGEACASWQEAHHGRRERRRVLTMLCPSVVELCSSSRSFSLRSLYAYLCVHKIQCKQAHVACPLCCQDFTVKSGCEMQRAGLLKYQG